MVNTPEDQRIDEQNSLKDYINLIRNNILPIVFITLAALIVSVVYAINSRNIYKSATSLKISKPQGNILENSLLPNIGSFTNDRFIATEIEIMKSYNIRSHVAEALIDSFETIKKPAYFYLILNHKTLSKKSDNILLSIPKIAKILKSQVSIDQKRGIDIVDITVESPSPYEAALIANSYANAYKEFNLEANRNQLTVVKNFLAKQSRIKQAELITAENALSKFQAKGGIIALDEQAKSLIKQLSNFEAQRDAAKIDLAASIKVLNQLKIELATQNPKIAAYLESLASQSYFQALQDGLAKLEVNKDLALAVKNPDINNTLLIKKYDDKINALKGKLKQKINVVRAGIFASNPKEISNLTKNILEAEVNNKALNIKFNELAGIVKQYELKFNKLPETSIKFARLERKRQASEQLYALIEQKYQEALINEQSQPGNVLIVDKGRIPYLPAKPNRVLIVMIGLFLGVGLAFGYVFIRNYFDNTVKTPEDIQKRNINVLAWIPKIEGIGLNGNKDFEFIVAKKSDSIPSEAFRALRTRVQFSKIGSGSLKTILITSSTSSEGKTIVCVNLAGTFAQSNKKTLIIDCDLRKPRVHTVFNAQRYPGLIDYLFEKVSLDKIIRSGGIDNLSYITTGTLTPTPSETLESKSMKDFISEMRSKFDIIIIDSAPLISVADSEILASLVDASILVVSADSTDVDLMQKAVELIKHDNSSFIGTVLNNFTYKSGYGSYYKYYYYYSSPENGNSNKKHQK